MAICMEARFRHGITITRKKKVKIAGYKFTILWKKSELRVYL